ncbi:hypothetical protein U91I_03325 [alpha proteobacterium U9-1i]|nr:hypothetical protein U91I_03325 [alpha proteobacterium U9-1i]
MQTNRRAGLAALVLAAFCAFVPGLASAQGTQNPYAVAGVYVDETAANAAAAQQAGFAAAQQAAFSRLLARLTLPEEIARQGQPVVQGAALEQLVLSVDVEEERRSATRYIGRLTVRFDPTGVRTLLRNSNLTVVDTRTAPVLVVPVAPGASPETAALWREVWVQGGFQQELVPLATAPETLGGNPDWAAASAAAQAAAAASALYATVRVANGTATATLVEVASGGVRRDRGEAVARINGEGAAATRAAFASLAQQASARLQNEWKARTAVGTGQRARVSASALYTDERQWESIKQALEGAASTLISEIRIEAVGRDGALVSFSFVGNREQLNAELQRRGVILSDEPRLGPVLRVARR